MGADWGAFAEWCAPRGLTTIPATPARPSRRFWLQSPTASSARSRSPAARRAQDHPNPCDSGAVAAVLSGIRRRLGYRADSARRTAYWSRC